MSDPSEPADPPRSQRDHEYQDAHYHDDDAVLPPADDEPLNEKRSRSARKPRRRPLPRRHYED
jgi:hypothetical protein